MDQSAVSQANMVRHDEFDESFPFRVGDRVRVSSCSRKYRGRCGMIVVGREGSGFTSTFLSAYVQMKLDDGSGYFCATLRCTSLVLVPCPSSAVAPRGSELVAHCENLAKKICGQPPQALRMTKKLMREGTMANFSTIMEMSAALQVTLHQTDDHMEALNAFFEKRSPQFVGR